MLVQTPLSSLHIGNQESLPPRLRFSSINLTLSLCFPKPTNPPPTSLPPSPSPSPFHHHRTTILTTTFTSSIKQQKSRYTMNSVKFSLIDAFADANYKGNPAAVYMLETEKDERWIKVAVSEMNANIACFITPVHPGVEPGVEGSNIFKLKWHYPLQEAILCGHGTLASSYYLFQSGKVPGNRIDFITVSGTLVAQKIVDSNCEDFMVEIDFPHILLQDFHYPFDELPSGLPFIETKKTRNGRDILIVVPSEEHVREFKPDFGLLKRLPSPGIIVTAKANPGSHFDFVSRVFFPRMGVNEDPVCGSAHCALAPYWAEKLGKSDFVAYQASERGGLLHIRYDKEKGRVLLRGKVVTRINDVIFN